MNEDNYTPETHISDTMEDSCISLRAFILGEIKVYERSYSPKYEVIFFPNSWAWHNGLKRKAYTYYDKADALTTSKALKNELIQAFNNRP